MVYCWLFWSELECLVCKFEFLDRFYTSYVCTKFPLECEFGWRLPVVFSLGASGPRGKSSQLSSVGVHLPNGGSSGTHTNVRLQIEPAHGAARGSRGLVSGFRGRTTLLGGVRL